MVAFNTQRWMRVHIHNNIIIIRSKRVASEQAKRKTGEKNEKWNLAYHHFVTVHFFMKIWAHKTQDTQRWFRFVE